MTSRATGPRSAAEVIASLGLPVAAHCPSCGTPLSVPGSAMFARPGECRKCSKAKLAAKQEDERRRRVRVRVPAVYWWADIREGGTLERVAHAPAVGQVRRWLADPDAPPILLIRGETHSLKSTFAASCVRYETEEGRDAFFTLAIDAGPHDRTASAEQQELRQRTFARLRTHEALVAIDDLAKVLGGSTDGNFAAWRRGDLCAAIHHRWQARARTIITTTLENRSGKCDLCEGKRAPVSAGKQHSCNACRGRGTIPEPGIVELFGEDILARLTDERSAVVLRLHRKASS